MSIPIRVKNLLLIPKLKSSSLKIHVEWSSVGQSNVHNCLLVVYYNCLSAIRFRGGVILQVSCYTLLMRIPTSMATVLLSAPHGTPFRFIGRLEQIGLSPAYLENVRLNPSSPVLLTRNGPLRIFDTLEAFDSMKIQVRHSIRTDLKFERRPRSFK